MSAEELYANIFIPVDLSRSPKYSDSDKGRGIVNVRSGWIEGALPKLSVAGTPSEPFMRKLRNDVPVSLKSMTGFVDYDSSAYLESLRTAGDALSLEILAEWELRESKKINIRSGERFHFYPPDSGRGQFSLRGLTLYAFEYFFNYDGISVIVIHVTGSDTKTTLDQLDSLTNLNSVGISEWLQQCFEGLATDIMDLFPSGMNYGMAIALRGGETKEIHVSGNLVVRQGPIAKEDIWDLRSKYVFLGTLLTVQKATLYAIRAYWPIFGKSPESSVSASRDSLFSFLNRYWWIKISDNKSLTELYDAWHKENKTQEQISQLLSEMQLYWTDRENISAKASARRIEQISEWGAVFAIVSLAAGWESLLNLGRNAVLISAGLVTGLSVAGLAIYRKLKRLA
jgi:hypothetical protein